MSPKNPKRGPTRPTRAFDSIPHEPADHPANASASDGASGDEVLPAGYAELLEGLKQDIRTTRVRASVAANRELIALYWRIGGAVVLRQTQASWGSAVLDRLATDLRRAFPGVAGFSRSNLFRIRAFYLAWAIPAPIVAQPVRQLPEGGAQSAERDSDEDFVAAVPTAVAHLPWGHNVVLLQRVKDPAARRWYAEAAVQHGWSRTVLELQIKGELHARQGKALTNFARALASPDSDLAQQTLKDPYLFDFLTLAEPARERELEQGLVTHVERFLLELGAGFAFVGRQVHLEVGGADYYIDLLFYHLQLRCYVVVELKTGPFQPEVAGKLNFYLSAVDDLLRHPDDKPTIGLLLCRTKNRTTVEYALRDVNKPIGVADWEARLVAALPEALQGSLPTVEELERELDSGEGNENTE